MFRFAPLERQRMSVDNRARTLSGVGFCVLALFCFASQDVIVKYLSGDYPVLEILTIRVSVVLFILLVVGFLVQGPSVLRSRHPILLLTRGVLAFMAFTIYYLALTVIPLANAAAVFMTAPLLVTLLSILVLGERVGFYRWGAIVCGLVAVMIILNPGSSLFAWVSAMPLLSALCYAMIPIITRRIGLAEHPLSMAIYTSVSYLTLCLVVSGFAWMFPLEQPGEGLLTKLLGAWVMPDTSGWFWLLLSASIFALALVLITQAYRIAPVSSVAPFEYSYILWATLLGLLVFGHIPDLRVIVGALLVVAAGVFVTHREQRT